MICARHICGLVLVSASTLGLSASLGLPQAQQKAPTTPGLDWRAVDAKLVQADIQRLQRLTPKERQEFGTATVLMTQATKLQAQKNLEEALSHANKAYHIQRDLMGERSLSTITANALATRLLAAKSLEKAEPAYKKRIELEQEVLGENHPTLAKTLAEFAALYQDAQRLEDAEPLLRRVLNIRQTTLGERHKDFLSSLDALASVYKRTGDFAHAEPLYKQEHDLCLRIFGSEHAGYAVSLNNLANLFVDQGDFEQAQPLFERAVQIFRRHAGENPIQLAKCLNNLASVQEKQRNYKEAETFYLEAKELIRTALGERSPGFAGNLLNLGALYLTQENYFKAEAYFEQARSIYDSAFGQRHPHYILCLNNLAVVHRSQRRFSKAEELLQQVKSIRRQTVGEKHHQYALALVELAILHTNQSDYAKAEPLCRQAVQILRPHLEATAIVQSERQQLAHRVSLDPRVSTLLQATEKLPATTMSTYDLLIAWKGSVTARQRLARLSRASSAGDPEVKKLFEELNELSRQIAAWNLVSADRVPEGVDVTKMLATLTAQREQAEAKLSKSTADFSRFHEGRTLNTAGLQSLLPDGAVLIDFVIYRTPGTLKLVEQQLAAFVVTRAAVRRVELGKLEPIRDAIESFRASIKRASPVDRKDEAAGVLRQRLLAPLVSYLSDAKLVLIAPEGPLTQLPFAALPGKTSGTYFLEQVPVAVLPVPQMLPDLVATRDINTRPPGLLAVGDVDFDGDPASREKKDGAGSMLRAGSPQKWLRLPGTHGEVLSIEKTFRAAVASGTPTILRGDEANETAVRRLAPGHSFLHFATHGFFAPREIRSATQTREAAQDGDLDRPSQVSGWNPQLLSGIVLAGANKPRDQDDGVLTAYELAGIDLEGVELAVLSACETGLGQVAGGEGTLGLQRAFQIAGARSVITSLWSVPDEATRVLMERFYVNLWSKKMTKLEALRDAQIWMLRHGRQDAGVQRGIERLNLKDRPDPNAPLPPYYWAAFVLSGDWR